MAKIIEITASVAQTYQIAKYSPRSYHASVKIEVGEKEKVEDAFKLAREKANQEVENYFKGLKEKIKKQQEEDKKLKEEGKNDEPPFGDQRTSECDNH